MRIRARAPGISVTMWTATEHGAAGGGERTVTVTLRHGAISAGGNARTA